MLKKLLQQVIYFLFGLFLPKTAIPTKNRRANAGSFAVNSQPLGTPDGSSAKETEKPARAVKGQLWERKNTVGITEIFRVLRPNERKCDP